MGISTTQLYKRNWKIPRLLRRCWKWGCVFCLFLLFVSFYFSGPFPVNSCSPTVWIFNGIFGLLLQILHLYIYIYLIFQKAKKTFTIMIQTAIVKKCSNQFSLVVSRVFSLPGIISLKIRCGTWSPQWPASDALSDFTKIECMTCLFNTLPMLYMYTKKYVYVLLHYISAMHQMCVCLDMHIYSFLYIYIYVYKTHKIYIYIHIYSFCIYMCSNQH